MIKHLKHHQIDKHKWDELIDNSHFPLVYAKSWYLDICSPNWEALVYGDYEIVMPLTLTKKIFIKALVQVPYSQQLGLFTNTNNDMFLEFYKYITKKYLLIRYSFNESTNIPNSLDNKGISKMINYILPLNSDYTHLKSNYSDNCLRNCKKSYNNNLKLDTNIDIDEFMTFHNKTIQYSLSRQHLHCLEQICKQGYQHNSITIHGIRNTHNELISALVWLHSYNRHIYLSPVSSSTAYELRAMFFILDQYIQTHSNSKIIIDFEGSMMQDKARFFSGFGAKLVNYYFLNYSKLFFINT